MRLLFMFFICLSAQAANFACTNTGATGARTWTDTTAWTSCNSTYPNNGGGNTYTFTVGTAYNLTIPASSSITIGQSLAANTAQGTVNATGSLTLASGTATAPTILTLQGDLGIVGQTTCTVCTAVSMGPSTVLLIDSNGSGTSYAIGQTQNGNPRTFSADCTDATTMPTWASGTTYGIGWRVSYNGVNYISLANSNTGHIPDLFDSAYWKRGNCLIASVGATNGAFTLRGLGFGGGNVVFKYAVLYKIGTASIPAFLSAPDSSNNATGGADVQYSTFDSCGQLAFNSATTVTGASVHRLYRSIISNSLTEPSVYLHTYTTALTSGIRSFSENILIGSGLSSGGTNCGGCTVEGNYIYTTMAAYSGTGWTNFTSGRELVDFVGNFVFKAPSDNANNAISVNAPTQSYNYIVNGQNVVNQNTISISGATVNTGVSYNVSALVGPNNTGDSFVLTQSASGLTHTFTGNATELNRDNDSTGDLITDLGIASPGGTDNHVYKNNSSFAKNYGIVDLETSTHWAGSVTLQNNTQIAYGGASDVLKVYDTATAPCSSNSLNPNNVCSSAQCNYNLGVATASTGANACTNGHNGYNLPLSASTGWGVNDTNVSTIAAAQFADLTRTFATAASAWLGHTATAGAWTTSTAYAVGDIVSDAQSIWQGKTVLYRALAAHTSAATTRPGNGATWLTGCSGGPCWEYATAYYLRNLIADGTRITDASTGANNDYPAKAMALWTLSGRISSRRDLQCMGNDGESPWPIAYCAKGKAVAGAVLMQ